MADSPFLPARGGGEREYEGLVRAVAGAGGLAALVLPCDEPPDPAPYRRLIGDAPLVLTPRRRSPVWLLHPRVPYVVASRPVPDALVPRLREAAPDATAVLVASYKSWQLGAALARGLGLPAVVRQHNREGEYHRSLARGSHGARRWALDWDARRIERDELALARADWVAGTADISAEDAAWRSAHGGTVAHVPPFAADATGEVEPRRPDRDHPYVLFLAALDVPTNLTALGWLLDEVWPRVGAARPGVRLVVAGRRPDDRVRSRVAAAGAELLEDVPDLAPLLATASVAVNPAVSGAGVNIKLVDYLAAGVPVVSTTLATRGLDLRAGVDLLVADDPEGFAAAVSRLLGDPDAAEALGASGRARARAMFDPAANLDRLAALLPR